MYTYNAIIVSITRRRDDYEENSYVSVSGCGGGNVRSSGIRRLWLQHMREAVCSTVREAMPGTLRPVRSAVRYVPVAVQLGLQLVNTVPMPEPVPEAVRHMPEAVQHLQ